jgi:hypothetical protein
MSTTASWTDPAGNSGRPSEAKAGKFGNTQPVDLTDACAAGVDERYVLQDSFLSAIAQSRRPPNSFLNGGCNVGPCYDGAPSLCCPKISLGQYIFQLVDD